MAPAPVFFLIHGAWAGPWIWKETATRLADAGFRVTVADPLGQGDPNAQPGEATFETAVARLVAEAETTSGALIAVGHSGGGVLASALAEAMPDRMRALVYLAGFMLPSKMNYAEVAAKHAPGLGISPHLRWNSSKTASSVPLDAAKNVFMHDCDPSKAEVTARRLTPFPEGVRGAAPVLTEDRFGRVPRVYIECAEDRSIPLAAQRDMQRLVPGARRVTLRCGHVPMLASFEAMIAALLEVARETSRDAREQ